MKSETIGQIILGCLVVFQWWLTHRVQKTVDGPLTAAIKTNAEVTAKLASAIPSVENLAAAEKARILYEAREAGKAEVKPTA